MDYLEIEIRKNAERDLMIEELLLYHSNDIDMDYLVTLDYQEVLKEWKNFIFIGKNI